MSRFSRGPALLLFLLLLMSSLPIMAQTNPGAGNSAQAVPILPVQTIQHGVPWRDTNSSNAAAIGFAAPAGAHLSYNGGPIISNVQVVQVLYGSGSYNAQVAGTQTPTMGNFYNDI